MMFHSCRNLGEWLNLLAEIREEGKTLTLADDPGQRLLGFFDGETTYTIPFLRVVDRTLWWDSGGQGDRVHARLGLTREGLSDALRSQESRAQLVAIELPPKGA